MRIIARWERWRLEKIASFELRQTATESPHRVNVGALLDELRIVIEPPLRESGIETRWHVPESLPQVWADGHVLLQVFLNLTKNSARALEQCDVKLLAITASLEGSRVLVRVEDNGPGVAAPDRLFQPFQSGAESTGLGLYLSRALVRGFGGDLEYEPRHGSCFTITMAVASEKENSGTPAIEDRQSAFASVGRSYVVSRESEPPAGS
jgi:two-component system, LuxR family, sensor kinase FixL